MPDAKDNKHANDSSSAISADSDLRIHARRALFYSLGLSITASLYLMTSYLRGLPDSSSLFGYLCFWWAALSSICFWHLLILLPYLLTKSIQPKLGLAVCLALCCLFNIALLVDATIYGIYRFHFNGMVWNLLTTPGAGDSFTLGVGTVLSAIFSISTVIIWIVGGYFGCKKIPALQAWRPRRIATILIICSAVFLILSEKTLQIVGDVTVSRDIARTRETTPFYISASMKRYLRKHFGIKPAHEAIAVKHSSLNYPKEKLQFTPEIKKPNILFLFIEGARFDCLSQDCMPQLYQFGQQHITAQHHLSGGNASRFGIFSGLYGLNATYWHSILADRKSPVLIDVLQEQGYEFGIFSSTNLNFPEFRQTAFVNIPDDRIHDQFGSDKLVADQLCADGLIELSKGKEPWFGFAFFDASHQPYRYPEEDAVFAVDDEEINYIALANNTTFDQSMFNKYRNSLHYIDRQIERVLSHLQANGTMENTILIAIGDHGEAFGELGFFGHNSTFSRYQTQTLGVFHLPGQEPLQINRATSHYDIPATILSYMGCTSPYEHYTNGQSILDNKVRPDLILASWSKAMVYVDHHYLVTGYRDGDVSLNIYNADWQEIPNSNAFMRTHPGILKHLLESSNAFQQ